MRSVCALLLGIACLPATAQAPSAAAAGGVVLRAQPGTPFVAVAAGAGAVYVWDAGGVVHVSLGGAPFVARQALLDLEREPRDPYDGRGAEHSGERGDGGDNPTGVATDPFLLQQGYGYVGDNVYLDYDDNVQFRQSAGDLFAFPYGTTGESYLEFTPDSPAFWSAPWFTNMARPDMYFPKATLSARLSAGRARAPHLALADIGQVVIAIDPSDARIVTVDGAFGRIATDDAGATWVALEGGARVADADAHGGDGDNLALHESAADQEPLSPLDDTEGMGPVLATVNDGARTLTLFHSALVLEDPDAPTVDVGERIPLLARARAKEPPPDRVLALALARVVPPLDDGVGLAPLLPRIDVIAGGLLADNTAILDAVFLDATAAGDGNYVRQTAEQVTENQSQVAFERAAPASNGYVGVVLTWDLPSLFSPATTASDRGARAAIHQVVSEQVRAMLEARARIVEDLVLRTPADDDALLNAALDLEEANARLLALSGVELPRIGGAAGRALARLPYGGTPDRAIDDAIAHLGLAHDGLDALRSAASARAALPTLLIGAAYLETRLDEDDYLDEIGLAVPWVGKSAHGRILEARARLTWDLPHTLRAQDDEGATRIAWLRREVALDAAALWSARRRAQARGDGLTIEETTAMLSGITGGANPTDTGDTR